MERSFFRDRHLTVVCGVSAVMLLLIFVRPLGYDNTLMQAMAKDVLQYGRAPYTGIWIHDFPGILYVHCVAMMLFGPSVAGLRLFDAFIQLAFAVFLFHFWQRWFTGWMAASLAMLYIAYYVSAGSLLLSERDVYGAMLLFVCIDLLIRARKDGGFRNGFVIFAGLCAGLHILLRPMALLYLVVLAGSLLIAPDTQITLRAWRQILLMIVIAVLPIGLVIVNLSGTPGALREFYRQVFLWNEQLYAPLPNGLPALAEEIGRRALLLPFGIAGLIFWWRGRRSTSLRVAPEGWERLLYAVLLLSTLAVGLMMRKYFSYHFAPFFMLLLPFVASGMEATAARFKPKHRLRAVISMVILSTFITYYPRSLVVFLHGLASGQNPWEATREVQFTNPYWGARAERAAANYLLEPANRGGLVEICSFNPALRLDCGHACASRYVTLDALAMRTDFTDTGTPHYTSYQKLWQRSYVDSLDAEHPRFLILARNTEFIYLTDPYRSCLRYIPGFDSLLATSYRYDTTFGGYQVFRIRTDTAGGAQS